jgi:hypothetical protein
MSDMRWTGERIEYRMVFSAADDSTVFVRFWNILLFAPRYVLFGRAWL